MPVMLAARSDPTLRPTLRVIDVVAIIVGTVVGAGIFRTPSLVAANATSEAVALGAWVAGGAISLIGALCYAELAAAYPSPGGDYHYLARAFGIRLAFLFAWARITVIQTGSIALLAFVIGDYATGGRVPHPGVRPHDGLRAAHLRGMERGGVRLRGDPRAPGEHRAGPRVGHRRDHRALPARERGVPARPRAGRDGGVQDGGRRSDGPRGRSGERLGGERAHRHRGRHLGERGGVHGRPHRLRPRARLPAPRLSRPLASPRGDAGQRARRPGDARPRAGSPRRVHAGGFRDHGGVHRARVLAVLPPDRRVAARAAAPGAGGGASVHGAALSDHAARVLRHLRLPALCQSRLQRERLDRRGGGGGGRRARPRADGTSRRHPSRHPRRRLTCGSSVPPCRSSPSSWPPPSRRAPRRRRPRRSRTFPTCRLTRRWWPRC